jgi:hypothetical protein
VDLTDPESVAKATKDIEDAKAKYADDKDKFEER